MKKNREKSLRKQLNTFLSLLILCLSFFWIISMGCVFSQNKQYLEKQERQMHFSSFYQKLNQTHEYLRSSMLFFGENIYRQNFEETADHLKKIAGQLRKDYSSRILYDLQCQTETYLTYAAEAVKLRYTDLEQSQKNFEQADYICELIQKEFNQVYDELDLIGRREMQRFRNERILMAAVMIFTISAVLAASVLYSRYFSESLTRPILSLAEAARKIGRGQWVFAGEIQGSGREIQILASGFDYMVTQMKRQMLELKEKGELEYQVLQAQINPHFLFNTLNMIQQLTFIGQPEETMKAVELLSKLLRYGISRKKYATAEQEMENARDYMQIQQIRYNNRLEFQAYLDPSAVEALLPLIILQPLVENSVIHGMSHKGKELIVGIEISKLKNKLQIRVYDNGKGMTEEELENLKYTENSPAGSVGLKNIRRRLEIFFREDVDVQIKSQPYVYTEVFILVPFITEEDYAESADD